MQYGTILRILGTLIMLFSLTMLPPFLVAMYYADSSPGPFLFSFCLIFSTGLLLWYPFQYQKSELRVRDGFLIVVLFWTVLGLFGSLPFLFSDQIYMSFTEAAFESLSGLTTTGATVLTGLDNLPHGILYYRQQIQWLGGLGIIVLAVAVLPMLGVGGMQLYKAETPGPMKDKKLTPRITETAKALWYIYLGLTIACACAYWLAGMSLFDAIGHSFATVAIGGFSTHDQSIGYFHSPTIEMVAIVFMLLSGINFSIHFIALQRRKLRPYLSDVECRSYLFILLITSVVTTVALLLYNEFTQSKHALHHGIFQTISIGTTTGFTTADFAKWPAFLPILLLILSFIGGCAGSTGGGMKVIRILLLMKQGAREIKRLIHPNAYFSIKLGKNPIPDRVIEAVWGFFSAYVIVFTIMLLLLMLCGLDQLTAFSAVTACLNNLGPGLGDVALNYGSVPDIAKWVLCLAMLMGRLEIFTLLVLFTPYFWRP